MWKSIALFAAVLGGCAASRPVDDVASRFKHRVPVEMGEYQTNGIDRIEVVELWGTRPQIEIGGEYVVVGRYSLQSEDAGRVTFFLTSTGWNNSGPIMDLQQAAVKRGTGTFTLQHKMEGPGTLHVTLYGTEKELADQYFDQSVGQDAGSGARQSTVRR